MDYSTLFDEKFEKRKAKIIEGFAKKKTVDFAQAKISLMTYMISKVYNVPEACLRDRAKDADYPDLPGRYLDESRGMLYFFLNNNLKLSIRSLCRTYKLDKKYIYRCIGEIKDSTNGAVKTRWHYLEKQIEKIEF